MASEPTSTGAPLKLVQPSTAVSVEHMHVLFKRNGRVVVYPDDMPFPSLELPDVTQPPPGFTPFMKGVDGDGCDFQTGYGEELSVRWSCVDSVLYDVKASHYAIHLSTVPFPTVFVADGDRFCEAIMGARGPTFLSANLNPWKQVAVPQIVHIKRRVAKVLYVDMETIAITWNDVAVHDNDMQADLFQELNELCTRFKSFVA